MFDFIFLCIAILSIIMAIYTVYSISVAKRSKKEYEEAKQDLAVTINEEYSKLLGKGEDGAVYYDWGLDILEQLDNHDMFSLDEAIDKFRKSLDFLKDEDKADAEDLLHNCLYRKFLRSDFSDDQLNSELEASFEKKNKR